MEPKAENKAIARRFIQAWNAGGQNIVDELAAPDIVVFYSHFAEPVQGAEGFKQILTQTFTSFPDLKITPEEPIIEGDQAVVRWTYRATHQQGEIFSISPSGKQIEVSGITIYRIANGKVIEERGVVDNLSLMFQLGAVPASGPENG